ncbi:MAG: hypothetical protein ILO36_09240, partial [Abditibacteriota bacterium]|nr:hypothetical protein [Abditibacteriota bacterium]
KTDLVTDGNADGLTIYKGEKNGGYYLWIKNSRSIEIAFTAKLYYLKGAVKERTVFWLVGSRFRSQLEPLPDLEKF